MPTYDYRCDACGHEFEEFQSFSEKTLKKCPKCKKSKLRRLLGTGAAILFKGSGFYQTDYRSEGYKNAAKADGPPSSSASDSSSGKDGAKKTEGAAKNEGAAKTESNAPAPGESKGSKGKSPKSKS